MDNLAALFSNHVKRLQAETEKALLATGHDSLVVSSGAPLGVLRRRRGAPRPGRSRTSPTGARSGSLAACFTSVPGRKPRLVRHAPEDYWYEQGGVTEGFWLDTFAFEERGLRRRRVAGTRPAGEGRLPGQRAGARARAWGSRPNREPLTARLDWLRSYKDDYEVRSIEEATAAGARGHAAAREAFAAGASELEIHQAFCRGGQLRPRRGCPTRRSSRSTRRARRCTIGSKRQGPGAAACCCSTPGREPRLRLRHHTDDAGSRAATPRFVELVESVDGDRAGPGGAPRRRADPTSRCTCRPTRQRRAGALGHAHPAASRRRKPSSRATRTPSSRTGSGTTWGSRCTTWRARQSDASGTPAPPPKEHPYLRNTRTIEPGHVFTMSPGIYFIPMLLRRFRSGAEAERLRLGAGSTRSRRSAACGSRTTCS